MICALVSVIILCVGISASTVASGECGADGNNLTWTLDSAGVLTVSGNGEMADFSFSGQPWYSNAKKLKTWLSETA